MRAVEGGGEVGGAGNTGSGKGGAEAGRDGAQGCKGATARGHRIARVGAGSGRLHQGRGRQQQRLRGAPRAHHSPSPAAGARTLRAAGLGRQLSFAATRVARGAAPGGGQQNSGPNDDWSPGFYVVEDEPSEVVEKGADGSPTVVAPRIELTLEWLVESPPPEHTWEEPPIFYDVVEE